MRILQKKTLFVKEEKRNGKTEKREVGIVTDLIDKEQRYKANTEEKQSPQRKF